MGRELAFDVSTGDLARPPAAILADFFAKADQIVVAATPPAQRAMTIEAAGNEAVADLIARRKGEAESGMLTGIRDLDDRTGGLVRGEGSVIGGRTSMGKTAPATQIALNVARQGVNVLIFSLEMTQRTLAQRMFSLIAYDAGSPIPYVKLRNAAALTEAEVRRLHDENDELRDLPLVVDAKSGLNVAQIAMRTRKVKKDFEASGVSIGLVVIDYLNIIAPSQRYAGDRGREIAEASKQLHGVAKDLDVHLLMLCQFNRRAEDPERPELHDLADSDDIARNADLVLSVFALRLSPREPL